MKMNYKRITRNFFIGAAIALIYFVSGKLGLKLAFFNPSATPVWPPTGIAIASMLLLGYRFWPSIFIGALATNLNVSSPATSLGIAIGNTLEGVVGVFLINKFANGKNVFNRTDDIVKFIILAVMLAPTISATIGVTSLLLGGFESFSTYLHTWTIWWLGDVIGALLIGSFIILWSENFKIKLDLRRIIEFTFLTLVLCLVAITIFIGFLPGKYKYYPLQFMIVPILVFAAFRFTPRETITFSVIFSIIAIWGTLRGYGPFAVESNTDSLLLLQGFIGVISTTSLILSSLVLQQKQTESIIKRSLEEKTILLKELQHRIKNNLQVISSLLSLHSPSTKDKSTKNMLSMIKHRVGSMALAHDYLYKSGDSSKINFDQYIKDLVNSLINSYGVAQDKVKVNIKVPRHMPMATAITIGLIVNELVTNSLKYAFTDNKRDRINITLSEYKYKSFKLIIKDNGKGIPDNSIIGNKKNLGLQLVNLMVNQLDGSIRLGRRGGASFTIIFPKNGQMGHSTLEVANPIKT